MRTTSILASALALLLAAAGQATQVDGRPLFDVHSAQVFDYGAPLGLLSMTKDWSVSTDGTTSSIVRFRGLQNGFGPVVETRLNIAPASVFRDFTGSFVPVSVGALAGNCSPYSVPPGQSYHIEITWYGHHGRVNHFILANDFSAACPQEMFTLLNAVATFEKLMIDPNLPVW